MSDPYVPVIPEDQVKFDVDPRTGIWTLNQYHCVFGNFQRLYRVSEKGPEFTATGEYVVGDNFFTGETHLYRKSDTIPFRFQIRIEDEGSGEREYVLRDFFFGPDDKVVARFMNP